MHDGRVLRLGLLSLLLALVPATAAAADEPAPDTTPPRVIFAPCHGTPADVCQQYEAVASGHVADDSDLAVVGARMGDEVLDEYVYNDGSGPAPYGYLLVLPSDVVSIVDWAVRFVVPPGTHPVTFYARDLAGNTVEQLFHLTGATAPARPEPVAVRNPSGGLSVFGALDADAHGSYIRSAEVVKVGTGIVRRLQFLPPSCRCVAHYPKLRPGTHTFRARARNQVGWSRWTTFTGVVPPRHSYS